MSDEEECSINSQTSGGQLHNLNLRFAWMQIVSLRQFLPVLLIALLAYQAIVPCWCASPNRTTLIDDGDSLTRACRSHCCHHASTQAGVDSGSQEDETPKTPQCPFCDDLADVHVPSREQIRISILPETYADESANGVDGVAPQIRMTRNNECRCLHRLVRGPLGVRLQV
ncbi:hypothetical protein Mal48_11960 [Thalassoglobus polymorphus]|uniref:Uncharacterized protein n=1 Tax=Thalassoglobus polymorphus TaxID=2527994 RepID=A0A517QK94_9PLAN|nr:hypothetical protein Mal48_11960 [Thalassoglobus polymorphus]